jgi:hypothetical protein
VQVRAELPGLLPRASVTEVELSAVSTLLWASSTETLNDVDAPAVTFWFVVGWVVKTNWVAVPGVIVIATDGRLVWFPIAYTVWLPTVSPAGMVIEGVETVPPLAGTVAVPRVFPALHELDWSMQ